jgi:hypothetical protein
VFFSPASSCYKPRLASFHGATLCNKIPLQRASRQPSLQPWRQLGSSFYAATLPNTNPRLQFGHSFSKIASFCVTWG